MSGLVDVESFLEFVHEVEFLPCKEFDFLAVHYLGCWDAAEVSVRGGGLVYGIAEPETFVDAGWCQVYEARDDVGNLGVGVRDVSTDGAYIEAHGLSHADCVCYLHKHFVSYTCGNEVLCDVAGGISG